MNNVSFQLYFLISSILLHTAREENQLKSDIFILEEYRPGKATVS